MVITLSILKDLKSKLLNSLAKAPKGTLRVSKNKKQPRYYHVTESTKPDGVSISVKNIELAKELAQASYEKKALKEVEREIQLMETYEKELKVNTIENIYENLSFQRKKLVKPVVMTDDDYAQSWQNEKYIQKAMDLSTSFLLTDKGERVRSKSEILIANKLKAEGIPYRYECKYTLLPERIEVCPDFTVLNKRTRQTIIFENFGLMDNPDYVENTLWKIEQYQEHGWTLGNKLVFTMESLKHPLNTKTLSKIIDAYFK